MLGINVRGNVIVLRHSVTRPYSITNIHPSEKRLIDLVVLHRYRFQCEGDMSFAAAQDGP
ncbi:hypothetical protein C8Q76DRAFT_789969 [Earliella scabrosa]|nr:hypothetical protein C8Q76DRAFT_789969 [Earliella scabrosa]